MLAVFDLAPVSMINFIVVSIYKAYCKINYQRKLFLPDLSSEGLCRINEKK